MWAPRGIRLNDPCIAAMWAVTTITLVTCLRLEGSKLGVKLPHCTPPLQQNSSVSTLTRRCPIQTVGGPSPPPIGF